MQRSQTRMMAVQQRKSSSVSPAAAADVAPMDTTEMDQEALTTPRYSFPDYLTRIAPTQVTTLDNGFRIVTEPRQGETAAVGVYIGAGSRHETRINNGAAHFLEHMYFKVWRTHHTYTHTLYNLLYIL